MENSKFQEDGFCIHRAIEWLGLEAKFNLAALRPHSMISQVLPKSNTTIQPLLVDYVYSKGIMFRGMRADLKDWVKGMVKELGLEEGDKGLLSVAFPSMNNPQPHALGFFVKDGQLAVGPEPYLLHAQKNLTGIFLIVSHNY